MRPKAFVVNATAGGVTYSPVFVVDSFNTPCNIGIGVIVSGSVVYDIQHSFVDPRTTNLNTSGTTGWFNNDVLTSATVSDDTNYAFPPAAIRLALRAGTGQATVTIIQAGPQV